MNETENNLNQPECKAAECCADLSLVVRNHPVRSLLVAAGVGILAAVVIRTLQPQPVERHKLQQILEDLRERLGDLADPAYRRAKNLASEGADLVHDGVDHISKLHLDRPVMDLMKKLRNLFN